MIGLITDTHLGCRNDHKIINEHNFRFLEKVFVPYLVKHDIQTIIHLGDVFDRRKYINYTTLNESKRRFFDLLKVNEIQMHCILGNHDTAYKNTSEINSPSLLLQEYDNIFVYESPTDINIEGITFGMLPWINKDNKQESIDFLRNSKSEILCGHMEIAGFEMNSGIKCETGIPIKAFDRFDMVFSGHFHKKTKQKHIHYLGTPYQMTFADVSQTKGFHILDPIKKSLKFVPNNNQIFYKLFYDDVNNEYDFSNDDFSKYERCFVKIVIMNKSNPAMFDELMDHLYNHDVAQVSILEVIDTSESDFEIESVDMSQDTINIIKNEIDSMTNVLDKEKLKNIMSKVYVEAMNA